MKVAILGSAIGALGLWLALASFAAGGEASWQTSAQASLDGALVETAFLEPADSLCAGHFRSLEHRLADRAALEAAGVSHSSYSAHAENLDPLVDLAAGPAAIWQPVESPWPHAGLYANGFYYLFGGPQYFVPPPPGPPPRGAKPGMLQRVALTGTWLASGDDEGFGVTDIELKPTVAVPLFGRASPLIITPGAGVHLFDGPVAVDLPGQVYDTYVDVRWMRQLSTCVGVDLAVTPGWFSDWEQDDSDALRIGARGLVTVACSPALQLAAGVVYLDRDDVPLLPLGGIVWSPHPDIRYELIAPRPRIARRLDPGCESGRWVYVAGEFGGGSWAIAQAGDQTDVLNYQDWRLVLGMERSPLRGLSRRLEAGYVFGRQIEFERSPERFDPDDTLMLRAEMAY